MGPSGSTKIEDFQGHHVIPSLTVCIFKYVAKLILSNENSELNSDKERLEIKRIQMLDRLSFKHPYNVWFSLHHIQSQLSCHATVPTRLKLVLAVTLVDITSSLQSNAFSGSFVLP